MPKTEEVRVHERELAAVVVGEKDEEAARDGDHDALALLVNDGLCDAVTVGVEDVHTRAKLYLPVPFGRLLTIRIRLLSLSAM